MLAPEQFYLLKKNNICKDPEKAKERIGNDFKATTKAEKDEIRALSGLTRSTFYHAGKTGLVSIRLAISLGQVLDANPYYYIGAVDERGEFNSRVLRRMLDEYGYGALPEKPKRAYNRKNRFDLQSEKNFSDDDKSGASETAENKSSDVQKTKISAVENEERAAGNAGSPELLAFDISPKMKLIVKDLELKDAVKLLEALYIRADVGGSAQKQLETIKCCLLS